VHLLDQLNTAFGRGLSGLLQLCLQPFGPDTESLSGFTQFAQFGIGVIVIAGLIVAAGPAPNLFGHEPSVSVNKEQPVPTLQMGAALSIGYPNAAMPGADTL
jgi:hypothetical protein